MSRKGKDREDVPTQRNEEESKYEKIEVIQIPREMLLTRIEFIDEFLRHFGGFLSNDSLNAINAYKQALQDILKAVEGG